MTLLEENDLAFEYRDNARPYPAASNGSGSPVVGGAPRYDGGELPPEVEMPGVYERREEAGMPIGFAMALARSTEAMRVFGSMPPESQDAVLERARRAHSSDEMRAIVCSLEDQTNHTL